MWKVKGLLTAYKIYHTPMEPGHWAALVLGQHLKRCFNIPVKLRELVVYAVYSLNIIPCKKSFEWKQFTDCYPQHLKKLLGYKSQTSLLMLGLFSSAEKTCPTQRWISSYLVVLGLSLSCLLDFTRAFISTHTTDAIVATGWAGTRRWLGFLGCKYKNCF